MGEHIDDVDDIDEALEETFPASDPPANTVETGIAIYDNEGDEDNEDRNEGN